MKRRWPLSALTLTAGLAVAAELSEPDYQVVVKDTLTVMSARHFGDIDRWIGWRKLSVVASLAATHTRVWEWTGEREHAAKAADLLRRIAELDIYQADFFTIYPMMYVCSRLQAGGMLPDALFTSVKEFAAKYFVARDLGLHNQAMCRAAGLELAAQAFPDLPEAQTWHQFALDQWQLWYGLEDITENAPNYNQIDLVYVWLLADALACVEQLKAPGVRAMFARFRDQVSPGGAMPAYGDSGNGTRPRSAVWPLQHSWGYWPAAFERAASFYQDPTFRWAAVRMFHTGCRHEPLAAHYGGIQALFHLSLAADWRGTRLTPAAPEVGSAVLTRREPGNPRALDKLVLASSRRPGAPFLLCDLYVRGSHAHQNQHGAVIYFEHSGVPLLYMLGYNNRAAEHCCLFMVRNQDESFPHAVPHFEADRWREASLPTVRMQPIDDAEPGERMLDGIVFRIASPKGVQLWLDDLRLQGPKGSLPLDPLDAVTGWRGPKEAPASVSEHSIDGGGSLTWQFGQGVSKITREFGPVEFDCGDYTHIRFSWKQSNNDENARPLIVWPHTAGSVSAQYPAHLNQLEPVLRKAVTERHGEDLYGLLEYDDWFGYGTRLTRELILAEEGVLVVRDTVLAGPDCQGKVGGPIWHVGTDQDLARGENWFNSAGATTELLVWFGLTSGQSAGVQTVDVWGLTGQRTVFAKQDLVPGREATFVSVLVPHPDSLSDSALAAGISLADGAVRIRSGERPTEVTFAGGGWQVTRRR